MSQSDLATLRQAYARLENPSLAIRLSSAVGMPVESVARQIGSKAPEALAKVIGEATRKSVEFVMFTTARTLRGEAEQPASPRLH